jgi:hypothetical protein
MEAFVFAVTQVLALSRRHRDAPDRSRRLPPANRARADTRQAGGRSRGALGSPDPPRGRRGNARAARPGPAIVGLEPKDRLELGDVGHVVRPARRPLHRDQVFGGRASTSTLPALVAIVRGSTRRSVSASGTKRQILVDPSEPGIRLRPRSAPQDPRDIERRRGASRHPEWPASPAPGSGVTPRRTAAALPGSCAGAGARSDRGAARSAWPCSPGRGRAARRRVPPRRTGRAAPGA